MRPNSVVRPALRIVGLLAVFACAALVPCGVAAADSVATNFEPSLFHTGSVNGQDGWKSDVPGDIPSLPNGYDQEVVANSAIPNAPAGPAAFGSQSLRISNAYGTGPDTFPPEFELQTYSKPTSRAAGEGLANTEYTAQFSFISVHPDRQQPRLRISVSPDNGHGGRMSYIGLDDLSDGIHVIFYDTPSPDGDFAQYDLATLPRDRVHTIRFWMKLNPGPENDLVRIFIDGKDVGQCFTTWENYYRAVEKNPVPISDRLLFLSGNRDGDRLSLLGGGYLFDDVTTTTGNGAGPPGCGMTIDKQADSATVTAGGLAGYQISLHNHGPRTARNLLLCDRIPRRTALVRANKKLHRFGRRRCLKIARLGPGQSTGFHIDLRVAADAPPGDLVNVADVIPGELPGLLPLAGVSLPDVPADVAAAVAQAPPIKKVQVLVRIVRARRTAPAPGPPPFTG